MGWARSVHQRVDVLSQPAPGLRMHMLIGSSTHAAACWESLWRRALTTCGPRFYLEILYGCLYMVSLYGSPSTSVSIAPIVNHFCFLFSFFVFSFLKLYLPGWKFWEETLSSWLVRLNATDKPERECKSPRTVRRWVHRFVNILEVVSTP